jgi:hypothetical protein
MRVLLTAALLLVALSTRAGAQAAECSPYSGDAARVCTAAVDGTRAFAPTLGLLESGGNAVLGTANTLGGPGHFSLTARVNAVHVVLPKVSYDGSTSTVPAGEDRFAPGPVAEGALGVYGGLPSGALSVDVLASAQLLPTTQFEGLGVDRDARRIGTVALGLGYGARLGVLRETGPLPAISVSVMRRDIPTLTYGDVDAGDEFQYSVELHATNFRLVASKQLAVLGVAAGLGWDKYTGDALIQVRNPGIAGLATEVPLDLDTSRALAFLDAGLDLSALRLIAEVGYQAGKDQHLSTQFEKLDTSKGKFFAGFGLRLGL